MTDIKKIIYIIYASFITTGLFAQKIVKWTGGEVMRFSCGRSWDIGGRPFKYFYFVGISKKQIRIQKKLYRKLVIGYDSTTSYGFIRLYNDTVFYRQGKKSGEQPFLSLSQNGQKFEAKISGLYGYFTTIVQDTSRLKNPNGYPIENGVKFNIRPATVAADADYVSSIIINDAGIVSLEIKTGHGGVLKCKCE
jgi:hypothetical protein